VRLFVAIELDDEARTAIAAVQRRLKSLLEGKERSTLKWVSPGQMHLTLAFLGEVPEDRAVLIIGQFGVPFRLRPFEVIFQGLGVFPPTGAPRVLWLGVFDGARESAALQEQVAERLETLGFPREARPFHPHLTLARWRSSTPGARRRMAEVESGRQVARIRVDAVALVQSRLSPAGATHAVLARVPLAED
jgi:2'-5' RNA ligase